MPLPLPSAAPALAFILAAAPATGASVEAAEAEVMKWRAERDERLRSPEGWVSLVGLHWLPAGESTLGSGPDNDIVLNAGPARVGTVTVEDGEVRFCAGDPRVTVDGERVDCERLASDAEERYSRVRAGSMVFHLIDREGELALRVKDAQAQTLRDYAGMDYFPFDPAWRFEARFQRHEPGRVMEVPNVQGRFERAANPGRVVFGKDGEEYALEAVRYAGEDELFLIFADRTNGKSTYGAGRFVYTPLPDRDNRLILDFNKAYNPPCVFTPYATCPLPPPENRLPLAIEAGEKKYALEAH